MTLYLYVYVCVLVCDHDDVHDMYCRCFVKIIVYTKSGHFGVG